MILDTIASAQKSGQEITAKLSLKTALLNVFIRYMSSIKEKAAKRYNFIAISGYSNNMLSVVSLSVVCRDACVL